MVYLYTADDAGFMVIPPISPPRAVKAFPIATLRAVPSVNLSEYLRASYAFCANAAAAVHRIAAVIVVIFFNICIS